MHRFVIAAALLMVACRSTSSSSKPSVIAVDKARGASPAAVGLCADETAEPVTEVDAFGRKVAALCIEGASPKARELIEKTVRLAGTELTPAALSAALAQIHKTNVADDVVAFGRKAGPQVTVFIRIKERPRVNKVEVEGASGANIVVKKADGATPLHPGEYYDPVYARDRADTLRDMYVEEGFDEATVTPKTTKAGEGTVDVHMVIAEGTRAKLGSIAFKGVTKAYETDLLKAIEITRGDPFSKGKLERAPLLVGQFYYDRGHVNMRVDLDKGVKDKDGAIPITFVVHEGPIFNIGKIELLKSDLDDKTAKAFLAKLKTQPGQVFKRSVLAGDLETVKKLYGERGRKVDVEPQTNLDPAKKTIDVALEIRDARQ